MPADPHVDVPAQRQRQAAATTTSCRCGRPGWTPPVSRHRCGRRSAGRRAPPTSTSLGPQDRAAVGHRQVAGRVAAGPGPAGRAAPGAAPAAAGCRVRRSSRPIPTNVTFVRRDTSWRAGVGPTRRRTALDVLLAQIELAAVAARRRRHDQARRGREVARDLEGPRAAALGALLAVGVDAGRRDAGAALAPRPPGRAQRLQRRFLADRGARPGPAPQPQPAHHDDEHHHDDDGAHRAGEHRGDHGPRLEVSPGRGVYNGHCREILPRRCYRRGRSWEPADSAARRSTAARPARRRSAPARTGRARTRRGRGPGWRCWRCPRP